jgi:transcriptional regulator with XRE-family HTH domain
MTPHSMPFGAMLRERRQLRQLSQLELALQADMSQRHLSFLESGRARPSREMVLRIAATLALPLRARNELLGSAGFAAVYAERPLAASELKHASEALKRILAHHEPYPAFVLDRAWDIVMTNAAAQGLIARCADNTAIAELSSKQSLNFMRLMFHPRGLRPRVRNWDHIVAVIFARLRREAVASPDSPSATLLNELTPQGGAALLAAIEDMSLSPTVPLELQTDVGVLRLFNTLTTFGTPQDITLQELRIEMSFPMDEASDQLLRAWASADSGARP